MERRLAKYLTRKKFTLAVAESCTGGLISDTITNVPGSSRFFLGGVIAYANETKMKLAGVSAETLKLHGAVSKETALELARGVKNLLNSHIGLSVTGIAGPTGAVLFKPIGTVFVAVAFEHHLFYKKFLFKGTRRQIKVQAANAALKLLWDCLA